MYLSLIEAKPESYMAGFHGPGVRTFLDCWGKEFHFLIDRSERKSEDPSRPLVLKLFVWSDGPNKRDEKGVGDDIGRTFDVEVPAVVTE